MQQIVLSYRKYPEKSKCRLQLSTEVHSNVTPGAASADLRAYRRNASLLLREGTCNLRASCHKLLALLHPSGQEMTTVKQMLMVKNASTQKGDFYQQFQMVWALYRTEFDERALLVMLHQEILQFYCNLSRAHFCI